MVCHSAILPKTLGCSHPGARCLSSTTPKSPTAEQRAQGRPAKAAGALYTLPRRPAQGSQRLPRPPSEQHKERQTPEQ
eukprot:8747592-Alexandrium_andersonii.AAC.1